MFSLWIFDTTFHKMTGSVNKKSVLSIQKTSSFLSLLQLLERKKNMMELRHFAFDLGIDTGLKSLESILGKQFFFFSPQLWKSKIYL